MTTEQKEPGKIGQEDADNRAPKTIKKPGLLTRIVLLAIGPALAEHDRQKDEMRKFVQKKLNEHFLPTMLDRQRERLSQRPEWLKTLDEIDARRAAQKALAEAESGHQSCLPQKAVPLPG